MLDSFSSWILKHSRPSLPWSSTTCFQERQRRRKVLHMWQLACSLPPSQPWLHPPPAWGPQWGIMLASAASLCFRIQERDLSQSLGRPFVSSRTWHSTLETRGHKGIPEPKCGVHLIDSRLQEGWDVAQQPPRVQNPCRHSQKMCATFTQQKRAVWNYVSGVHPFVKSFCFTKEKEKKRKVKLSSENKISWK